MTTHPEATRRARMQRECEVSAVPVWLLLVACAALVFALGLSASIGDADEVPSAQPSQRTHPASG
jgi:hypothetical protein